MRVYTLQREQWVARPRERVFPFFAQPENLALITTPSLRFRLLTPGPVTMEKGRVIDYTIRVMGLPTRWRTLITRYDTPWSGSSTIGSRYSRISSVAPRQLALQPPIP